MLPPAIQEAAASFDRLPGIGPRAALRYAYWLAAQPKDFIERFARSLQILASSMVVCESCHQLSDTSPCLICRDPKRDQKSICVVASSQDIRALEDTAAFNGRYHVLGGTLDPIEGRRPETLKIQELVERIRSSQPPISEVILGLDTDLPGDTTALYITKQLEGLSVRITRLARGLPSGASLEYADANTLSDALKHRK